MLACRFPKTFFVQNSDSVSATEFGFPDVSNGTLALVPGCSRGPNAQLALLALPTTHCQVARCTAYTALRAHPIIR